MSTKIKYGILHPTKGLLGFSGGAPCYPNEDNPQEVEALSTSLLLDKDIQLLRVAQSVMLQQDGCNVVPVEVSYKIGAPGE